MANTSYVLEKIRIEGELQDLLVKTNGENVEVTYNGEVTTLTKALASILTSLTNLPTSEGVDAKISAAIDGLIDGAPDAYDTLKEIADYIAAHKDAADALAAAIGSKVDKVGGKGLSTEDFTTALKDKLENMEPVTAEDKAAWNGLRGVRYGAEPPTGMKDGELFVRVVSEE